MGVRQRVAAGLWRGWCMGAAVLGAVCPLPAAAQETAHYLEEIALFSWKSASITGLSALELSPDGTRFAALSDRGWYLAGSLERAPADGRESPEATGAITGVTVQRYLPLLGIDGFPTAARRVGDWSDAEGLVLEDPTRSDGPFWVSFERWARVERFESPSRASTVVPGSVLFEDYRENRQLEALARHPDGTLYSFSESPQAEGFAVYRFAFVSPEWVVAGHLPDSGWYAVVGADFDARGRLFVLERRHILGHWWQSRIRMIPDIARPVEASVLWTSRLGAYGNFEGIAVWGTPDTPRVTIISDNNGDSSEITEFLDFILRE